MRKIHFVIASCLLSLFVNTVRAQSVGKCSELLDAVFANILAVENYDVSVAWEYSQIAPGEVAERLTLADVEQYYRIAVDYTGQRALFAFRGEAKLTNSQSNSRAAPRAIQTLNGFEDGKSVYDMGSKYPRNSFFGFLSLEDMVLPDFAALGPFPYRLSGESRETHFNSINDLFENEDATLLPDGTLRCSRKFGVNDEYTQSYEIDPQNFVVTRYRMGQLVDGASKLLFDFRIRYVSVKGVMRAVEVTSEGTEYIRTKEQGTQEVRKLGMATLEWHHLNESNLQIPSVRQFERTAASIQRILDDKKLCDAAPATARPNSRE